MSTIQERFEAKFTKGSGCWEWLAGKRHGYGQFRLAERVELAPRVSYQLYVDEITDNLHVLHRCDNPACVRPDHLFLGTAADNAHDRENKGRGNQASGEKNGHSKLTEEQVKMIRTMWAAGTRQADLARKFGVAPRTICSIVHYHRWAKLIAV